MHNIIHSAFEAVSDWWWGLRNGPVEELVLSGGSQDYERMLDMRRDLMRDHDLPCRVITCETAQFGDEAEPVDFSKGHFVALTMVHHSGMMHTMLFSVEGENSPDGGEDGQNHSGNRDGLSISSVF